ncbi:MnmC family methyltransferase [Bdellovibrio sp. HCB-110]|uniref:MnmC family methyltransferase n=1 Tax=Bdellovibrio sp. HCB-110 TaxID=3391182 RepID=UPI0039B4BFB0
MKFWKDIGFEIEITADKSPTLRLLESVDPSKFRGESMHHSGGACAETLLIYGNPIRAILQKVENPHFLVVGLGLGYIEMTIAREALLLKKSPDRVGLITSYESVPELREFFFKWLHGDTSSMASEVVQTYEAVLDSLTSGTDIRKTEILSFLRHHFKHLQDIKTALSSDVKLVSKYHCILYDAFSSKTTPYLWDEEFLVQLLREGSAEQCLLSTYACRVSLKQALSRAGFDVFVREGFQGKRNSTLGAKNIELNL